MTERLQRVLVVYATVSGCTATIASRIGCDLIGYGAKPFVSSVEECGKIIQGDYDAIVLGSGVRVGRWHRSARDWIESNSSVLRETPLALFSVGLHGIRPDGTLDRASVQADLARVLSGVGVKASAGSAFIPGWKRTDGFSSMEKLALRVYPLADGDYRDWNEVDRWLMRMGPLLMSQALDRAARTAVQERATLLSMPLPYRAVSPRVIEGFAWEERRA